MSHWLSGSACQVLCKGITVAALLSVAMFLASVECGRGEESDQLEEQLLRLRNPVEIRSQRLELRRPQSVAVYSGQVLAFQEEYQLSCDRLEIHWNPETKKISQLIARGQVRLETDEGFLTSGMGVLDLTSKTIVLTESPQLFRGKESVEGERIIYSIPERKSTVIGGKERRVKSRIVPGGTR